MEKPVSPEQVEVRTAPVSVLGERSSRVHFDKTFDTNVRTLLLTAQEAQPPVILVSARRRSFSRLMGKVFPRRPDKASPFGPEKSS
jgi:hypothetical protein